MQAVVEAQVDAAVAQALAVHPLAHAGLAQHLDRALLQHAGADPRLHVLAAARLQDDRVDPVAVQQLPEQQPGRAGADDRHLCSLGHHWLGIYCFFWSHSDRSSAMRTNVQRRRQAVACPGHEEIGALAGTVLALIAACRGAGRRGAATLPALGPACRSPPTRARTPCASSPSSSSSTRRRSPPPPTTGTPSTAPCAPRSSPTWPTAAPTWSSSTRTSASRRSPSAPGAPPPAPCCAAATAAAGTCA